MAGVIVPNIYVRDVNKLIFLAGPIRGAPNWQDEAIRILLPKNSELIIATPRRGIRESFAGSVLPGDNNYFKRQRLWERHYLETASKRGAILFWLPGEAEHNCAKSYGAMTRLELGQWMTNYRHDNRVRFCVGSDGKFSELDIIRIDLALDAPDKRILGTLEETCDEALRLYNLA